MYNIAEIDNSTDIVYAIKNTLPNMKQEKCKDKYDAMIEMIKSKCYTPLDKNKMLLCDSVILRCIDMLHLGDISIFDNYKTISQSIVRNTTYNKETVFTSCKFIRKNLIKENLLYSPEEKLMLYILVSNYLKRIKDKKILLEDNLTYIDLKDIHLMFGNNASLKATQSDKYINIINMFIKDDIEIYIGNDKYDNGNFDKFTSWFSYIQEICDYHENIIGYVYTFGNLGRRFFSSTNYPTKYVTNYMLSINNRNYRQFELARYLIYNVTDRKKKIEIKTIMNELYDYNHNKTYLNALYDLLNPYNVKYLKAFLKSVELVLNNINEQFNLKLYYDDRFIDTSSINLYATMKDFDKLYLKISCRTE